MTYELWVGLIGFAFVSSITPGPNNMMLLASGVNFGVKRTIPHMLGVSLGHAFLVFLSGVGIAHLFRQWPFLSIVMKVLAVLYMLWLAWKIANAGEPVKGEKKSRPLTFFQAAAFQWVNPKGLVMAITVVTIYASDDSILTMASVSIAFCLVNLPCVAIWACAGSALRRFLSTRKRLRAFNYTLASLLVLSLFPVLL